jgi:hypothetical protein
MNPLLEEAKQVCQKAPSQHWSRQAAVLGQIDEGKLYTELEIESWPQFAESLELTRWEYRQAVRLWKMMGRCRPALTDADWLKVSKSRALELQKVIALGADAKLWFEKALGATTLMDFVELVEGTLGKEVWVPFSVQVPKELRGVIEAALVKALPAVLNEPHPDPERAKDKDVRFRCLEVMAQQFLLSVPGPGDGADQG